MEKDKKLEEIIEDRCVWKVLSKDLSSSTFKDVGISNYTHPLYSCKYICDLEMQKECQYFKDYYKLKEKYKKN